MSSRCTIIRPDGMVYKDGLGLPVDLKTLPEYFHAIQWYGDLKEPYGEIEFIPDRSGSRVPNVRFTDLSPFQVYIDAWQQMAEAEENQKAVEAKRDQEANSPR